MLHESFAKNFQANTFRMLGLFHYLDSADFSEVLSTSSLKIKIFKMEKVGVST